MEYRKIPHGDDTFSTIGIGAGSLELASAEEVENIIRYAMEQGVNFMDTIMNRDTAAEPIARALKGVRSQMKMQIHFGAYYPNGVYQRTRNPKEVQKGFEQELKKYGTDYADIGMIHCVDELDDFDEVMNGGTFEYASKLKQDGTIHYLGFASHNPDICKKFIETGAFDVFMLSLNASYDFEPADGMLSLSQKRVELYQECQKRGIGITVMKPYGGGQLLNAGTSPFGRAMTIPQCFQYALDRPAVLSCLPGVRSVQDLKEALSYYESTKEERDYSFLVNLPNKGMQGACIYCNHCQPCPAGIDIGLVSKYMDLAKSGDELAGEHYLKLNRHASDCIGCGSCERNCPFHVEVRSRIAQAKEFFGI